MHYLQVNNSSVYNLGTAYTADVFAYFSIYTSEQYDDGRWQAIIIYSVEIFYRFLWLLQIRINTTIYICNYWLHTIYICNYWLQNEWFRASGCDSASNSVCDLFLKSIFNSTLNFFLNSILNSILNSTLNSILNFFLNSILNFNCGR